MIERDVTVLYQQIAVFDASLENPFCDWTPTHVAQGFTFRRRSVSFRTLSPEGRLRVQIVDTDDGVADSTRAYLMPMEVHGGAGIEVATVTQSVAVLDLPDGHYCLRVSQGTQQDGPDWFRLKISTADTWPFLPCLLARDGAITKFDGLLSDADPA